MDRKRNRSAGSSDIPTEKVSPPAKMTKGASGSVTLADVMREILEIKKDNLEFHKWVKEVQGIKEKIETIDSAIEDFRRLEIDAKKTCVLIKGVKFVGKKKFETRKETHEGLKALFADLGGFTGQLLDYYRLGGRRDESDNGSKVPIRVIFVDVDQKYELYDALRTYGKSPNVKNIQILNDYPKFQVAEVKKLNQKGYELRQETPGLRTRIVPKGLSVVLQSRKSTEDKWTLVRES
jgi:hypothetical protein